MEVSRDEWSEVKFKAKRERKLQWKAKRDIVLDVEPLLKRLELLGNERVTKVVRKSISDIARKLAKEEKNLIQRSRYKQDADSVRQGRRSLRDLARNSIGYRVRTAAKMLTEAKAGVAVGRKNPILESQVQRRNPKTGKAIGTNGGVGISYRNIHWPMLGTTTRHTKRGANRGKMDKWPESFKQLDSERTGFERLLRAAMEEEVTNLAATVH